MTQPTILIVNDDPVTRAIVVGALMHHLVDVTLLEAESAEEAFTVFWKAEADGAPVNIVILDLNLPGREGLWMLDTLRADPTLKSRFDQKELAVLVYSTEEEGMRNTAELRGAAAAFHNPDNLRHLAVAVMQRISSDYWRSGA